MPSNFKFNTLFSSPLREDKRPSFHIKLKRNDSVSFIDFTTGERGNAFDFLILYYKITFKELLIKLINDFGLTNKFIIEKSSNTKAYKKIKYQNPIRSNSYGNVLIKILPKAWEKEEIDYWNSINVSLPIAKKRGRVVPIKGYYLNGTYEHTPDLAFAYCENKDSKWTFKIYRPFNKRKKWVSNNNYSIIELWDNLPDTGEKLIITSSRKDALCLMSTLKVPAIAPQAESVLFKPNVFEELSKRFKHIYVLFDNDFDSSTNWGQVRAEKFIAKYPDIKIVNKIIPEKYFSKDPSDLFLNVGIEKAKEILIELFS